MIAAIASMSLISARVLELLLSIFWSDPKLFADCSPTVGVDMFILSNLCQIYCEGTCISVSLRKILLC